MQDLRETKSAAKRRGPPPYKPTAQQRRDVALYVAGGMSEPAIAAELGICQNTLRKHFAVELAEGHERELAANLRRLRKVADKGNVTAMKHLDAKFGMTAAEKAFQLRAPSEPKPPKLGKKEQALIDAQAGHEESDWNGLVN